MTDIALEPGEALADSNGLKICFQTFGASKDPAVLLIMGLGAHMIQWEDGFCEDLAARGFFVIRFDNRDIGKSSKIDAPADEVGAALKDAFAGKAVKAPYLLSDMANDALGLLDAIGIEKANIVGASMGGAIAQEIAIRHPERMTSLVSIMASTGERDLPPPDPQLMAIFMAPPPRTIEDYVKANVEAWRLMRPHHDEPEEDARDFARAERAARRAPLCPEGGARQLLAMIASGGRRAALAKVEAPTLVIHGADDPLVPLPCGEDVARAIPGAKLLAIQRMGHARPKRTWPQIIDAIAAIAS